MEVETFECEEVVKEHPEVCEEAVKIIEELGLSGQKGLISNPVEDGPAVRRIPYRVIKQEEIFAYGVLCPQKVKPDDYRADSIPLRVLQVFQHAKSLEFFDSFEIWCAPSMTVKDPVLVGKREEILPGQTWKTTTIYILARWGSELETFPVLLKRAVEKYRADVKQAATEILSELESVIRCSATVSDEKLIARGTGLPSFYFNL